VRQVHGHQVNLETVKAGLWVKSWCWCWSRRCWYGADYLTDKYTKEGSNAIIGGKAPSGFSSGAAMGANVRSLGLGLVALIVDYMVV
jgi:hypothetical protein